MATPADIVLSDKHNIARVLRAIAEGYPTQGCEDRYIIVENPDYDPTHGSDPNLMLDIYPILDLIRMLGGIV